MGMAAQKLIPASEALKLLGYGNRSSLTRLVKAGKLTPANEGRAEQLFDRADVERLAAERVA